MSMILRDRKPWRLTDVQENLSHFDAELDRLTSSFSSIQLGEQTNVGPGAVGPSTPKSKLLLPMRKVAPLPCKAPFNSCSRTPLQLAKLCSKEPVVFPSDTEYDSEIEATSAVQTSPSETPTLAAQTLPSNFLITTIELDRILAPVPLSCEEADDRLNDENGHVTGAYKEDPSLSHVMMPSLGPVVDAFLDAFGFSASFCFEVQHAFEICDSIEDFSMYMVRSFNFSCLLTLNKLAHNVASRSFEHKLSHASVAANALLSDTLLCQRQSTNKQHSMTSAT
ncbi:uncharacterized protein PHACADRAFT_33455 [Phanerochaete carnosa HHB-10118-sp]|uniref:Uncharacterized protein n=1 Tax=Phanerochaete carnosa (strain HHB-10118-sp) TaxID=650164 RepID=K5VRK9_PHACS|nr:uncharacterized protein PHACADRAFT_33455 [Phanerochaete carnosa HHB-10118-sp]EKM49385.1 hypothetical protein PHACADRAFT_33455 [Phanerochaete carnosa HHB-10118-sp]